MYCFRTDSTKQIWPEDLDAIYRRLPDLPTDQGFPAGSRALFYQEIITLGMHIFLNADGLKNR